MKSVKAATVCNKYNMLLVLGRRYYMTRGLLKKNWRSINLVMCSSLSLDGGGMNLDGG